jgi:hypothetical protein
MRFVRHPDMLLPVTHRPPQPQTPAPTFDARAISAACPSSPNPVTSVHPVAPHAASAAAARPLRRCIASSAPTTQRARPAPRMAAARMVPVPRGLVKIRSWPGRRPDLRRREDWGAWPVMVKPGGFVGG